MALGRSRFPGHGVLAIDELVAQTGVAYFLPYILQTHTWHLEYTTEDNLGVNGFTGKRYAWTEGFLGHAISERHTSRNR